jgi:ribosomal protein S18 acetylase RimI-like enzyme
LAKISKYAELAKMMGLPFWIFAEDQSPMGLFTLGKEPIQLLAPVGTPIAVIDLVQKNPDSNLLKTFASQTLQLALDKEAEIATVELPAEEKVAVASFLEVGFTVLGDSYIMSRQLDQEFNTEEHLQFKQVRQDELPKWLSLTVQLLSGSGDAIVERRLRNLAGLPDQLMAMFYSMETFYFVNEGAQEIGILNFNPSVGRISNIGVDPGKRRQGYGRQIMLFGLHQLKEAGCQQAKLGVRVENKPALHLYESLGFTVAEHRKLLVWESKTD